MTMREALFVAVERHGDRIELLSPGVGWWRGAPIVGDAVISRGSAFLGVLDVLGRPVDLKVPDRVRGTVVETRYEQVPQAVDYRQVLVVLEPDVATVSNPGQTTVDAGENVGRLSFRAPSSGRFYRRPGSDQPEFVQAGDVIEHGDPVGLLEIMKTFNRVAYGGHGLPARARVLAVVAEDDADVEVGDVVLELEPC